ncbi:hypothetical protein Tco_1251938 [Tanacetum coccineum]
MFYTVIELSNLLGNIILDVDFLWKEERVRLLVDSPGASSTLSCSPGPSAPLSYSPGPSTPQSHPSGTSRNAWCSNFKHLLGKIKLLEATLKMYMHPEQHTRNSTALLHEVYNDMGNLGLEWFVIWNAIRMIDCFNFYDFSNVLDVCV